MTPKIDRSGRSSSSSPSYGKSMLPPMRFENVGDDVFRDRLGRREKQVIMAAFLRLIIGIGSGTNSKPATLFNRSRNAATIAVVRLLLVVRPKREKGALSAL